MCSLRHGRRVLAPCFPTSHSPAPHSVRPVLPTRRCRGALSLRDRGRGTSSASARRHRVEWSGTARVGPGRPVTEPTRPSVWRKARWNTALGVIAVKIARGEYQGCPPGVVCGSARQPSTASSVDHTVRLPRWRKLASYSRQVWPYLLRDMAIGRPKQVWCIDVTYIPMRRGFLCLVALVEPRDSPEMDSATRKMLSWRVSNTTA